LSSARAGYAGDEEDVKMAMQQVPTPDDDDAARDAGLINSTDHYIVQSMAQGRWKRFVYRSLSEAILAAQTAPDPRAKIIAVAEDGSKVPVDKSRWVHLMQHAD
jgi:hypothetical protein